MKKPKELQIKLPKGWRWLQIGEKYQSGDLSVGFHNGKWNPIYAEYGYKCEQKKHVIRKIKEAPHA